MIKNFVFGGNYFARGEFVLYINHSGKYIEINFNMNIPFYYKNSISFDYCKPLIGASASPENSNPSDFDEI